MGSLVSFLPYQIANDLLHHARALQPPLAWHSEAVVLFADVSGFTPMSEALARLGQGGTEELTARINQHYALIIERVTAFGGEVAAFGGDALTAIFPLHTELAAARALQCALDLHALIAPYAEMQTQAGRFQLAIKIGLAVGSVLTTVVGEPQQRLFTALAGAPVVQAASAERHAHSGEVVITPTLAARLPEVQIAKLRGSLHVVAGLATRPALAPLPPLPPTSAQLEADLAVFLHPAIAGRVNGERAGLINEHRNVTALFIELTNLMTATAAADPNLHQRLQQYVAAIVRIVHEYDGDLDKLDLGEKGCTLLVVFGAPVAHEDDVDRAMHCALALRALRFDEAHDLQLQVRIGIAAGLVFCGLVGSELRREYTVMGDTINLAARLMQAAAPGAIIVAAGAHRRVAARFSWRSMGAIPIRGWSRPVTVYGLEHAQSRPTRYLEPSYHLPMVGREAEMQQIEQRLAQVLEGHGQVIGIAAEAGMGKSRLLTEVAGIANRRGMHVISGECLSHGANSSYLPWHSLLRGLFGIDPLWSTDAQLRHLVEQLTAIDEQILARLPLLGVALNLEIAPTDLTRSLDARIRKDALETTVIACVRALTGSQRRQHRSSAAVSPLLMIVEDCHWIDPLSRDLLEVVARSILDRPVLILLAYRPAEPHQRPLRLTTLANFSELVLREFSVRETEWLIGLKFGYLFGARGVLPSGFVERISERSQGNPFYIDQMITYLQDQGVSPDDPVALERVRLPDSLRALIISRIDRLSEPQQVTLKVASVIGRVFRASWLWAIYPPLGAPDQVCAQLDTLSRLDLTALEKDEPELEYLFKHIVTQEVAYESLSLATRTTLHEAVAQYIEDQLPEEVERHLDTLAFHYGRSLNLLKQRVYFQRAGEAAQAAYANEVALDYFSRLRPLLPTTEQIGILLRKGTILQLVGRLSEAETTIREALALAEAAADETLIARCWTELASLLASRGDFDQAVTIIDAVMPIWEQLDNPAGHYDALWVLGSALTEIGEYTRGLRQLEHTNEIAVRLGDQHLVAKSISSMGVLYADISDYEMALYCLERSVDLAQHSSDWGLLAPAQSTIGFVYLLQERVDEALEVFLGLLERATEIGDRRNQARIARLIGRCHQLRGDEAGAIACYSYQIALALELGERRDTSIGMGLLASAYAQLGDHTLAVRVGELAVSLCDSIRLIYWACAFRHELALSLFALGRAEEAAVRNASALVRAHSLGTNRALQLAATLFDARLSVELGTQRRDEAVARLSQLDDEWFDTPEWTAISYTLALLQPDDQAAQAHAINQLQVLLVDRPTVLTAKRLASLVAIPVPPLPPLSPLPDMLTRNHHDLVSLIDQAESLLDEKLSTAPSQHPPQPLHPAHP
ncbi:MAG: adenylate/guanylate cyclase domain-containing protein [Oscillochloridaceae bacterium umkhey_bin13]